LALGVCDPGWTRAGLEQGLREVLAVRVERVEDGVESGHFFLHD
jgi:hypothetical protein